MLLESGYFWWCFVNDAFVRVACRCWQRHSRMELKRDPEVINNSMDSSTSISTQSTQTLPLKTFLFSWSARVRPQPPVDNDNDTIKEEIDAALAGVTVFCNYSIDVFCRSDADGYVDQAEIEFMDVVSSVNGILVEISFSKTAPFFFLFSISY